MTCTSTWQHSGLWHRKWLRNMCCLEPSVAGLSATLKTLRTSGSFLTTTSQAQPTHPSSRAQPTWCPSTQWWRYTRRPITTAPPLLDIFLKISFLEQWRKGWLPLVWTVNSAKYFYLGQIFNVVWVSNSWPFESLMFSLGTKLTKIVQPNSYEVKQSKYCTNIKFYKMRKHP